MAILEMKPVAKCKGRNSRVGFQEMAHHGTRVFKHNLGFAGCALLMALLTASCTSPSYDAAAMEASSSGDQKTAISLAKKEVARFSEPDQCSNRTSLNCGTLALTYGSLAGYQIMDGDRAAGESSFGRAKTALSRTDIANRPSATGMVYRDVSEAYWKAGDRARAVAVIKEGRAAGGDEWLMTASAAKLADQGTGATLPAPSPVVDGRD
jgi:hypothetical protein